MKTRTKLTVISAAIYCATLAAWRAIESPARGAVTAAQMDDTINSYVAAQAIRENFVEDTLIIAFAVVCATIWLFPTKTNQTNPTLK